MKSVVFNPDSIGIVSIEGMTCLLFRLSTQDKCVSCFAVGYLVN